MKSRRLKKTCASRSKNSRSTRWARRQRKASSPRPQPVILAAGPKPAAAPKDPIAFTSLDFPDRHLLYPHELADRLGCCIRHVYDLIAEGQLRAIDISGRNNSTDRRSIRIPIESWRQFLNERTM